MAGIATKTQRTPETRQLDSIQRRKWKTKKGDDQKPRQQWAIRTTRVEWQEAAKGRGECNQSLLNAARLAEAVARATIKHFSCNKLKLKAEKKKRERARRGDACAGEKQFTAAWRKHHVHHVVPVALSLFFCLLCA